MLSTISVTGTKGKTSVVRAIATVLAPDVDHVLRVDTDGAWLDDELRISHNQSKELWGLAPANAPGRFMTLLADRVGSSLAVLEANLFCSKACGLGYSTHSIGIFTNVFEDHKGADKTLQTSADIARAKSFIFSRTREGGYAIYNADDQLVVDQLRRLPRKKTVTTIACALTKESLPVNGCAVYVEKDTVWFRNPEGTTQQIALLSDFRMYVPGFAGSVYNVLFVVAALIAHANGEVPNLLIDRFKSYLPSDENGRLAIFRTAIGTHIIFDYAHETQSLKAVAQLARNYTPRGSVIGVLRLSPTRTPELIAETAQNIAADFDQFIIYDKVDGVTRTPDATRNPFKKEKVGYTANIFADALMACTANSVHMNIVEEQAVARAAGSATEHDTVVVIQGNDAATTLQHIKSYFGENIERIA